MARLHYFVLIWCQLFGFAAVCKLNAAHASSVCVSFTAGRLLFLESSELSPEGETEWPT